MIDENKISYYALCVGREDWKPSNELVWNVIVENNNKMEMFNIFEYNSFRKYLKKLKGVDDFDEFSEKVRKELSYYFWAKYEWEIVVSSFPTYITHEELETINKENNLYRHSVELECGEKIDVYSQIMLNWERFIEYVWKNKRKL